MDAIEIKGLCKSYGDYRLDNFSLSLPKGSILGLAGENGAGKSTVIKLIMNAERRDAGSVRVLGTECTAPEFSDLKNDIGIVLDEADFPAVLTPKMLCRVMASTYKNWNSAQYFDYVRRFGLPENKKFKDFSRGMKMKLAIAAALSHDAKLLILDEATGGLDPLVRDEILDILRNDNLHTVVLSDTLCKLIHKVERNRVFFVDENVRLVYYNDNFSVRLVKNVIVAVFDNLVVEVFQHEKHLRVCDCVVSVCKQRLEVKRDEILLCGDCGGVIPKVRVSAARREF